MYKDRGGIFHHFSTFRYKFVSQKIDEAVGASLTRKNISPNTPLNNIIYQPD